MAINLEAMGNLQRKAGNKGGAKGKEQSRAELS